MVKWFGVDCKVESLIILSQLQFKLSVTLFTQAKPARIENPRWETSD